MLADMQSDRTLAIFQDTVPIFRQAINIATSCAIKLPGIAARALITADTNAYLYNTPGTIDVSYICLIHLIYLSLNEFRFQVDRNLGSRNRFLLLLANVKK